jgi:Fe-S cluster assembly protein SufD
MSALLESLQAAFSDSDRAASQKALEQAVAIGLPTARNEQWKYTSLRALSARRFTSPAKTFAALDAASLATLASIPTPRAIFINGFFSEQHSDVAALASLAMFQTAAKVDDDSHFENSHEIFAKLAAALAIQGMQLEVLRNTKLDALHLVFIAANNEADAADIAIHYRHRIVLHENAELNLVEHHITQGEHQHISNHLCNIVLHQGAQLSHARVQQDNAAASQFLRTQASLHSDARYRRLDLELGAHLSRHDLQVKLLGENASVHANGSMIANGRRHLDTQLDIQHIAKNTHCHLLWRGMASDRGRAVFHGGILIEKGADGSDAQLTNKNLLLSDNAEIDTQPVLVIHADEVTASHGATVGRLNDAHIFYLRARGIPPAQAKAMLTTAFCKETLQVLANEQLMNAVTPMLEKALEAIEVSA